MFGLCGWYGEAPRGAGASDVLDRMARHVGLQAADCDHRRAADGSALSAMGESGKADLRCHGSLWAAIEGMFRWTDARLAEMARDRGHAATLIEAYRADGERCPARLSGRYSLAVLDEETRSLLVATDRFGSRPVVYAELGGRTLVFGTTTDAVGAHPGVACDLAPQSVYNYLFFGRPVAPATIYRGMCRLGAGEALSFSPGRGLRVFSHGDRPQPGPAISEAAFARRLGRRLEEAVARCVEGVPDGALGALLGGGLDAGAVVATMRRLGIERPRTFAATFPDPGCDGTAPARRIARRYGADHIERLVTYGDIVSVLPRIAAAFDEPFGNASAIPAYCLAQLAAARGVSVMLAGEGGEALFADNPRYRRHLLFEPRRRLPAWLRGGVFEGRSGLPQGSPRNRVARRLHGSLMHAGTPICDRLRADAPLRAAEALALMARDVAGEIDSTQPFALTREAHPREPGSASARRNQWLDGRAALAEGDVRKVVRTCELAGIRAEFPFLDEGLADLAAAIPGALQDNPSRLRQVLGRAMRDPRPAAAPSGWARGFVSPARQALADYAPARELACDSLAALADRDLFDRQALGALRDAAARGRLADGGRLVWDLMTLELWCRAHRAPEAAAVPRERALA